MFLASMFGHKETKQVDNYMAGAVYAGRRPLFDRSVLVASVLLLLLSGHSIVGELLCASLFIWPQEHWS